MMSLLKQLLKAVAPTHPQPPMNAIDEAILDGMERDSRERASASHQRVVEAANRVIGKNGNGHDHGA